MLNINLPSNLWTAQTNYLIDDIKGGATPYSLEIQVYALNDKYPYKSKFGVHINYYNTGGAGSKSFFVDEGKLNIDNRGICEGSENSIWRV